MRLKAGFKRGIRVFGILVCVALIAFNLTPIAATLRELPERIYIKSDTETPLEYMNLPYPLTLSLDTVQPVVHSDDESLNDVTGYTTASVSLFGVIPIKEVGVYSYEERYLIPSGKSIGIAIHSDGVLVVATSEIVAKNATLQSPASLAGISSGDVIIEANSKSIKTSDDLVEICNSSHGELSLTVIRNEEILHMDVDAVWDEYDNTYKMGMWVRDSTAGIGTLSFYDPDSLEYAALGHAVTDIDTESVFTVSDGEITDCTIININKGEPGSPGKLVGSFPKNGLEFGHITRNDDMGIYGKLNAASPNIAKYDAIPLAHPEEVYTGEATLLTTLTDGAIEEYDCKIIKTFEQSNAQAKGLVIEITDKELLSKTGGIVQGMSGSPVIQNGKLAAVVTHVMINNPERGYCIYAFWMSEKVLD